MVGGGSIAACVAACTAASWDMNNTRGRLRRYTHIGGIATDHGATVRAARSTPSPSRSRKWRAALTWRRHWRAAKRRQAISEPPIAAPQSASLEDASTADTSVGSGSRRRRAKVGLR